MLTAKNEFRYTMQPITVFTCHLFYAQLLFFSTNVFRGFLELFANFLRNKKPAKSGSRQAKCSHYRKSWNLMNVSYSNH